MDTDFHVIRNDENVIINKSKPIIIGNNVCIRCIATIIKGTYIPDNTVIAANSLVNKELIEESSIYGGNPAKFLRKNISWEE